MAKDEGRLFDANTTVVAVEGNQTQRGVRWAVKLGDGSEVSTFTAGLKDKANAFAGGQIPVTVRIRHIQKPRNDGGFFDNYYLEDIAPAGQLPQLAMPAPGGTPAAQAAPIATPAAAQGSPSMLALPTNMPPAASTPIGSSGGSGGYTDEDKARMSRFAAQERALNFVSRIYTGLGPETLHEAEQVAKRLTDELVSHGITGSFAGASAPGVPADPQQIAQQVPGVQVGTSGVEQALAQAAQPVGATA